MLLMVQRAPGVACNALDGPQDEPGGRSAEFAMQGLGSDRRAPSTLAAGDEVPMNSRERRVQRAFQWPTRPGLLRALPHELSSKPHERTGAGGTQALCCDEPRDDTDNPDENRALA